MDGRCLSVDSLCYYDVYRCELGRFCTLPLFLTFFFSLCVLITNEIYHTSIIAALRQVAKLSFLERITASSTVNPTRLRNSIVESLP